MILVTKSLMRRNQGNMLFHQLSFKPRVSYHPSLPRFPHRVYTYSGMYCASLPPLRPPRFRPLLLVSRIWFYKGCDGPAVTSCLVTVAVGCSFVSPPYSPIPPHLYYHLVDSKSLAPFHPRPHCRPRCRPRSRPYACPITSPILGPFPLEYPSLFLLHFPPFRPYAPVLPSVLQLYISAASCAQSFCLHADAVSCLQRDYAACGITVPDLLLCFFSDVVDPKAPPPHTLFSLLFHSFLLYPFELPFSLPFPLPFPSPLLP